MLALLLLLQSGVPDPPTYDGWKKQLAVALPRIEAHPRDHRRALLFAVNPLGVQEDGVRSEGQDAGAAGGGASATGRYDGIVDLSPDFVYQSHGHRTDWGYEVEVRIPFKSLRYQSADPQSWGLQVV